MKKRLFALFLAISLSVIGTLLVSCQREPTAAELLEKASEKTAALEAYSAVMDMKMKMNMMGMSMDIPMTVDMKVKNQKDNLIMLAKYDMSMFGQEIQMDLYLEDGWMYFTMAETDFTEAEKYKTNYSEVMDEFDFTGDVEDLMQDLPEDLLTDVVPVKNEDGSRTVTVAIPDEIFDEVFDDLVEGMGEMGGATGDVSIKDATMEATVLKSGYYSDYKVEFSMSMNVSGIETECKAEISIHYNEPGSPVEIVPPAGYKDYPVMEE